MKTEITVALITSIASVIVGLFAMFAARDSRHASRSALNELRPNGGASIADAVRRVEDSLAVTAASLRWLESSKAEQHKVMLDTLEATAEVANDTRDMLLRHLDSSDTNRAWCLAQFERIDREKPTGTEG